MAYGAQSCVLHSSDKLAKTRFFLLSVYFPGLLYFYRADFPLSDVEKAITIAAEIYPMVYTGFPAYRGTGVCIGHSALLYYRRI